MKQVSWKCIYVLGLLLLLVAVPATLQGQADLGAVTGTVSDPSGAVINSVGVVATRLVTGEQFRAESNGLGFYSLLRLPIGSYSIHFRKTGFRDLDRTGIVIETQHTMQVSAVLVVGSVTETVTVTGTPVLELQTEVGTNMSAEEMRDLPISIAGNGRDITSFAFAITPNVSGGEWTSSIGGSQAFTKSVMIDGTSIDSGIVGHIAESEPSMDAIQESQIDTTGLRAEDGRSGGGAFLYEMKSGTNKFHGAAFGFLANEFLNANTWTNNWYLSQCAMNDTVCQQKYRRAKNRFFDYGFSGGGPIWKQRKMYIFAAYEKYMQSDWRTDPTGGTVPTAKMLTGDFSELLANAANAKGLNTCPVSPCPILTTGANPTPYTDAAGNTIYYGSIFSPRGTVYSNNVITDPISSTAKSIVSLYQSDYKPTAPGPKKNYPSMINANPSFQQTQLSFKFDWDVRANDHVAASYIYVLRPRYAANGVMWQTGTKNGGPLTSGRIQTVISNAYRISETHTVSSRMVNTLAYTFNAFQDKVVPSAPGDGANLLGFGGIDKTRDFPQISFNGAPNGVAETTVGTTVAGGEVPYNAMVNDSLSWMKGRHSMKFGMEYRALGFNLDNTGGALQFQFSSNTFAPTNAVQQYVGSAFANMMLGEVQSAAQAVTFVQDSRRKELAFFAQDDIRINSRLVVSADLRWELTRPLHVLHGNWSNFDVTAPNPAYDNIRGAVTWLNNPNGSFESYTDWHQLAPKVGGSYHITNKIVARGSFGVNFVPLGWNGYEGVPYGSAVGYTAVNRVNQVSAKAPAFQWDGGYPGVYVAPTGPTPGSSYIPWAPANVDPHTRQLGMTESWFAGVQYELPSSAKLEISYMGNSGRNLHDGALVPTNFPTWNDYQKLLNSGHIWDWVGSSSDATAAGVPYPYANFSGPSYAAVNPYPHVQANYDTGVGFTNSPIGQSGYNSLTIEASKQHGALNLDLSYSLSRTTGNTGSAFYDTWNYSSPWQDPYKYKDEAHWPSISDTVKGYVTYVLPFGKDRRFLSDSRRLNYLVGGWTVGTIVSYANGGEMRAVGSTNYYPGWSAVYTNVATNPNFKNQFKRFNPAWNPGVSGAAADPNSLFVDPNNFSDPTYGQLGNSPTVFSNWRGWGASHEDASLMKKSKFGNDGRYVVTLRAEFFDLFNRHYWNGPDLGYGSASFGHITGESGASRTGQVGARFEW